MLTNVTTKTQWMTYGALSEHASFTLRASRDLVRVFEEARDESILRDIRCLEEQADALLETMLRYATPASLLDLMFDIDDLIHAIRNVASEGFRMPFRAALPNATSLAVVTHGICRQISLATTYLAVPERSNSKLRVLVDAGVLVARADILWRAGMDTREPGWGEVFVSFGKVVLASERCVAQVEQLLLDA